MEKINLNKIAFIGGGAMAEAIIKGIIGSGLIAGENIAVGEHTSERCTYLNETYCVKATTDNKEAVRD
ncbi:MAG: NAD(P)-binding domain-containing protein, partial [Phascolarctobacterium sp.]|nr:NAD(P)-binding domain-containing protein [Phascolarctobacterium sp.]